MGNRQSHKGGRDSPDAEGVDIDYSPAGRKFEPIRWTLERASREFGLDKKTLSSRVKRDGALPGDDDRFSTKQIVRAIYGDLESERIRETRSKADLNEIEIRKLNGELVDKAEIIRQWQPKFVEMVRLIKSAPIPEDLQIQIQTQLEEVLSK